jgi:hypothetical protein
MKIFLDDNRKTPEGWVRCYWPDEVIALLREQREVVTHLSLDHDLGDDERGTGADVIRWLQEKVLYEPDFPVPEITIHTDNPGEHNLMRLGVESILRLKARGASE